MPFPYEFPFYFDLIELLRAWLFTKPYYDVTMELKPYFETALETKPYYDVILKTGEEE